MSSYYGDKSRDIPSWDAIEAEDSEDVIDQSEYQFAGRDHILFCIDASESMQTPFPDEVNEAGVVPGKSALHQALEAVVQIQRSKVITGPADSVGVLLYNVDSSKSSMTGEQYKPGTFVYQSLRTINAEEIKRIIKLMESAQTQYIAQLDNDEVIPTVEPIALRETFPACDKLDELNIADVLVTCNFLFRDAGTKLAGNKRIFLVTDNDHPPGCTTNREPARTVFGDLTTYGIMVNTYFINKPGQQFDAGYYWNDILGREDDDPSVGDEGLGQLADIMNEVVIRQAPKRTQFSIPLRLGGKDGDIEIGVSGYSLVSTQGKGAPKYVRMRGQAVEEVNVKTEYTSAETGAVLRAEEISQGFQFGNEATVKNVLERNWWESASNYIAQAEYADELVRKEQERRRQEDENGEVKEETDGDKDEIKRALEASRPPVVARTRLQFTDAQIKSFRSMGLTPGIKILGFQSPENLMTEDNIKHSYFIYPDEAAYTGSTRTFTALLRSCLKLDRHALALCRFRANHTPEFAVLIPQEETLTPDGGQDQPPGFHVIVLPYKDDIRDRPRNMTSNLESTESQNNIMAAIVRRLRFKSERYRSEAYPNPSLGYHYAQLQALAFEEDFDTDEFEDKALPKYAGVHKAAGELMQKWNEEIELDERAVEKLTAASKRPIIEINEEDLPDVIGAYKEGLIEKLKVGELRDYAKFKKISLTGKTKKSDIIDALREHLEKESGGKKAKKG